MCEVLYHLSDIAQAAAIATPVFQKMDRKKGWVAHFFFTEGFKADYIKLYIFI